MIFFAGEFSSFCILASRDGWGKALQR